MENYSLKNDNNTSTIPWTTEDLPYWACVFWAEGYVDCYADDGSKRPPAQPSSWHTCDWLLTTSLKWEKKHDE